MINVAKDIDFLKTIQQYRVWHLLAMQDIRQRYRRSVIGPFWLTLSTFISISALGIVYAKIFQIKIDDYLPYLSVGFIFWTFISGSLLEACGVFIQSEGIIKQINLPFGVHVMRMVWRNLITLAHHSIVLVVVFYYCGQKVSSEILYFPVALLLVILTSVFLGYIFGALCARFRDVAQVVASIVQVVFYITPVIWRPDLLSGHEYLLVYNPFFHYLQILRMTIMGGADVYNSWEFSIFITLLLGVFSYGLMRKYRSRIAYWL